jgi:Protein of unknown function (DUF3485)
MNAFSQGFLLILFLAAAAWRMMVGTLVPPAKLPAPAEIKMPAPPPGWQVTEDKPLTEEEKKAPGRLVTYRAPDGTTLTIERRIACPDRRDMPLTFFPRECTYLAQGWDFDERSGLQVLTPNISVSRVRVHRGQDRRTDLEGYYSNGTTAWGWHSFKMTLIKQRLRRQRPVWVLAHVITPPSGAAAQAASQMMLAALTEPPSTGGPSTTVVAR